MSDTAQVDVVATVKESSASYRETGPKIMDSVEVDATVKSQRHSLSRRPSAGNAAAPTATSVKRVREREDGVDFAVLLSFTCLLE